MKIAHVKEYGRAAAQVYVGKGSSLANPYDKFYGQKTSNASVQAYRAWLWKKLRAQDKNVMRLMDMLREDSTLLCYCQDDSCHAKVIVKAWSWLKQQGLVDKQPVKTVPKVCDWTHTTADRLYEEGQVALY